MNDRYLTLALALGSVLLGVAVVNVSHRSGSGRIAQLARARAGGLVGELALFSFSVGLPFVALILGLVGVDLLALGRMRPDTWMGFAPSAWVTGTLAAAGATASALFMINFARHEGRLHLPNSILLSMRDALYDEARWALLRAPGMLWLPDLYWAAAAGLLLALAEWALHPELLPQLRDIDGRTRLFLRFTCACVSALLFIATQNLWLMIAAGFIVRAAGAHLLHPREA